MTEGHNRSNWLTDTMSNRPFIVGALFLGTYMVPFLFVIALVLAYVFKSQPDEEWEQSHFQYLIRTFWITVLIAVVATVAAIVVMAAIGPDHGGMVGLAGLLLLGGGLALAFSGVRIILSMMKSASRVPIARPKSWLI